MQVDPEIQTLAAQLAATTLRNTASAIGDRIEVLKARKKDKETIIELEEIINNLLADKNELVRIAQAYEQEFVAQQISPENIKYISEKLVPILQQFMQNAEQNEGRQNYTASEIIDMIKPVLSVEAVTVLQLIGFNVRKAIGEPLTEMIEKLIASREQVDAGMAAETQRLSLLIQNGYLEVARDPEAYERLMRLTSQQ